jgi:hypothetical protein
LIVGDDAKEVLLTMPAGYHCELGTLSGVCSDLFGLPQTMSASKSLSPLSSLRPYAHRVKRWRKATSGESMPYGERSYTEIWTNAALFVAAVGVRQLHEQFGHAVRPDLET